MNNSWDRFITEIKLKLGVDKLSEKEIKFCMSKYILGISVNEVVEKMTKGEKNV